MNSIPYTLDHENNSGHVTAERYTADLVTRIATWVRPARFDPDVILIK